MVVHMPERFIVNEPMNSVIPGAAGIDIVLVFPGTAIDVVGDASVEHSRLAGENVNVEMAHTTAGASLSMTTPTVNLTCGRSQRVGAIRSDALYHLRTVVALGEKQVLHFVQGDKTIHRRHSGVGLAFRGESFYI
jgi:hypothetical protein